VDGMRQLGWYTSGHRIALDIARGLAFLHGISVVHGDLKLLNILLTRGWEIAKIGDVGVARFKDPDEVWHPFPPASLPPLNTSFQ